MKLELDYAEAEKIRGIEGTIDQQVKGLYASVTT